MKFTGERFIPSEQGKIRLEHYHRYAMVLDLIQESNVLDIACGEGYGSYVMADFAHSVVGVDISNEAIQHATPTYKKQNLTFEQGSATELNFPNDSFDIVVSFETIEHLLEQEKMLIEIRRVLKQDGLLIISSPNRPIYSEESGEHNEFHIKELDFNEFDELLKVQFPAIQYFGQRMMMGSMIKPLIGHDTSFQACSDNGTDLQISTGGPLQDPVYFVAVCSSSDKNIPTIKPSVLHPENTDLIKEYVGFAKWAQNIAEDKDLIINHLQNDIRTITSTITWRITKPLRYLESVIFSRTPSKKSSK